MRSTVKLIIAAVLVCGTLIVAPIGAGATPDTAGGADAAATVEAPSAPAAPTAPAAVHSGSVRWGPFNVPANGMTENLIAKPGGCSFLVGFFTDCVDMQIQKPCVNCFVTKVTPNLVLSGTNTPVNFNNMGMLHHVVNVNWSEPDVTCKPTLFGDVINLLGLVEGGNERWFASGNERTQMRLPSGYGYYIGSGDEWGVIVDLMNMASVDRQYDLVYSFEWVDAAEAVTPVWLDIDQCSDSEVDTPAGYSDIGYEWRSTLNGNIVAIGGHVHDQGIAISAENATTGEPICVSRAAYEPGGVGIPAGPGSGADAMHPADWDLITTSLHPTLDLSTWQGHISGMSICQPFTHISNPWWRLGDRIRMHTTYNHDTAHEGDMGIMVAFVDED